MCHPNPVLNISLLLCTEIFLPGSCISANGLVQKEYVTLDRIPEPWSYVTRFHTWCKSESKRISEGYADWLSRWVGCCPGMTHRGVLKTKVQFKSFHHGNLRILLKGTGKHNLALWTKALSLTLGEVSKFLLWVKSREHYYFQIWLEKEGVKQLLVLLWRCWWCNSLLVKHSLDMLEIQV